MSRLALCGLVLGFVGTILFGFVHAVVIVPIWSRVFRGLLYAVAIGLMVSWAYHEYRRSTAPIGVVVAGLRFGALFWVAGLPAMALGFGTRLLAVGGPVHWSVDVATVALAAAGGAVLLLHWTHRRGPAIVGAIALSLVLGYNGGPMPIENPLRGFGLPVGFLFIELAGGVILALMYDRLIQTSVR